MKINQKILEDLAGILHFEEKIQLSSFKNEPFYYKDLLMELMLKQEQNIIVRLVKDHFNIPPDMVRSVKSRFCTATEMETFIEELVVKMPEHPIIPTEIFNFISLIDINLSGKTFEDILNLIKDILNLSQFDETKEKIQKDNYKIYYPDYGQTNQWRDFEILQKVWKPAEENTSLFSNS